MPEIGHLTPHAREELVHRLPGFGDRTRPPTGVHVYEVVVTSVEVTVAELFTCHIKVFYSLHVFTFSQH